MKIIEKLKLSKIYELIFPIYALVQFLLWLYRDQSPPAPYIIKHRFIKALTNQYSIKNFIETGTYLGITIDKIKKNFSKIYTIELDEKLYQRAKKKYKKNKKIKIYRGDSSKILPLILKKIHTRSLFWLDAHFSKGITAKGDFETPILSELGSIFKHKIKNHLILIDDAREFNGQNDYPSISEIKKLIKKYAKNYYLKINQDMIIIFPKR